MNPVKLLIAEAVCRLSQPDSPVWAAITASGEQADVLRVDADPRSITTIDCLFDGEANVVLADHRVLPIRVFGRCDGRRAEVERVVRAA